MLFLASYLPHTSWTFFCLTMQDTDCQVKQLTFTAAPLPYIHHVLGVGGLLAGFAGGSEAATSPYIFLWQNDAF